LKGLALLEKPCQSKDNKKVERVGDYRKGGGEILVIKLDRIKKKPWKEENIVTPHSENLNQ